MVVIIELLWHLTGVSVEQLQTPVFEHPFTVYDGTVAGSFDNKSFETESEADSKKWIYSETCL